MANDTYDLVIANGHIADPDSGWDGIGNLGISGQKIAAITKEPLDGKRAIDASGLIVSPGFIDLHAHGQATSSLWMQAFDGVTTALELEAGMLPIGEYYDRLAGEGRPINYGASVSAAFARIATITKDTLEPDIIWGFSEMSKPEWQQNLATGSQLDQILELVEQGLNAGGLGIGLIPGYVPGTGHKEFYRLAELAKRYEVPTFTHIRYQSIAEPRSSFEGLQEVIGLSFNPGAHMHICHLNSVSLRDAEDCADLVLSAMNNGGNLSVEAYPYGAGCSPIGSAYYRDPNWRERFGVQTCDIERLGVPLTDDSFAELQKDHPDDLVVQHHLHPDTDAHDAALLDRSVLFPGGAIASDSVPWTMMKPGSTGNTPVPEGIWPLPEGAFSHPRSAGTYTRFLKCYVREQKKIPLIEAIRKAALIPAQILEKSVPQMEGKGRLKVGADADILVFDIGKVQDRATFARPNQHSLGMEYVIVNGTPLIESGNLNVDARPGKPVRRPVTA